MPGSTERGRDLPTPVKYLPQIQEYKAIEKSPSKSWLIWPDELRDIFAPLIDENARSEEEQAIVNRP